MTPLEEIRKALEEIKAWMIGHAADHKRVERDVEEVRDDLYGVNGRPAIKSRLQAVEQEQAACRAKRPRGPWVPFALGIAEKVIAGGLLAYLAWLLFVYRNVQ